MLRGRLTVSIGVATTTGRESVEPSMLVRGADAALYQAKRDGRNLVRVAEPANA
jgi:diguanylate cyclase (GGDEF)-like protein